uniref:Uncharacterized protein n=1 Tax=Leviviridae sp. TaxID=2027243 RepID=A0A514D6Q9_9VIRU|nr:MAG: hypothetical protein H4Bulk46563_000003 [Leviviridae sp.]
MFITRGKTRSRTLPGPTLHIEENIPIARLRNRFDYTCAGTQITESDGNRWPPPKGETMVDRGSEFYTQKKEFLGRKFPYSVIHVKDGLPPNLTNSGSTIQGSLVANIFPVDPTNVAWESAPLLPLSIQWPPDISSPRNALVVKGAAAVAACSPGNPIAHVATALGEFLQDVPRIPGIALWESRLRALSTVAAGASEFLNVAFGISPTIADMHDFLKAVHTYDKAIDQFQRDAGRLVRRSFHFPKEESVTEEVLSGVLSPAGWVRNRSDPTQVDCFLGALNEGPALPVYETIRRRVTERKVWFDGAFTYHLPRGYDPLDDGDRRRLLAELFGAKPDLNTLWNLAPWSWAVDWFSSAGNNIKNLQNHINYGTVMRYGYLMEETSVTDTYRAGKMLAEPTYTGAVSRPYPAVASVTLRTTTKKRIQANPFGFGLSWEGLSSFQQAIAAALGITRVVK